MTMQNDAAGEDGQHPDPEHQPPARPYRHLRIAVRLTRTRASVVAVWLVETASSSTLAAGHPIVARVDQGDRLIEVSRYPDPRVQRSTMREGAGHHFKRHNEGVLHVNVPFGSAAELPRLRIRVADLSNLSLAPTRPEELAELFDRQVAEMGSVFSLGLKDIKRSHDWATVAATLGLQNEAGAFEVFRDTAGRYRWRLRRGASDIVAVSGQGFVRRSDCEADLSWVRSHAAAVDILPLDVPTSSGKA